MDAQIMNIEKMNFSANDLSNFSALQVQNSQKTFDLPVRRAAPKAEAPHTKDFFEQIYDRVQKKQQ